MQQYKGLYSRWYRYDGAGVKHIKRFKIDEIPQNEVGYTQWNRGTGPLSEETYKNISAAVRKACLGVPKSESTKQKMREAKLGKPKTAEHRKNMSIAQQRNRGKNSNGSARFI